MARSCSICSRSDAGAINALLAEGRSARSVAVEFSVSEDALQRHAHKHATRQAAQTTAPATGAAGASDPTPSDSLDELVTALRIRALAGNPADTREYRLALAAQSDAKHAAAPQRDLATEPEWVNIRTRMLVALEPFPDARLAIVAALGELG
jgi:hypothetical protein